MVTRYIQLAPGEFYHIYNRGIDGRHIFIDNYDKERFLKLLYLCNTTKPFNFQEIPDGPIFEINRGDTLVDIGVYCLMFSHFHLLLHEKIDGGISSFMLKLATSHAMAFNKRHGRSGRLFESTYKVKHLNRDNYLNYIFAYIHLNPVEHIEPGWKEEGIKDLPKAKKYLDSYKYSSYHEYLGKERPEHNILNRQAFPEYFSGPADFDSFITDWLKFDDDERKPEIF